MREKREQRAWSSRARARAASQPPLSHLSLSLSLFPTLPLLSYGASLFFLGYCLPQVPLVWLAVRFTPGGPPKALAACCLLWGCAAAGMAAVTGPSSFYAARVAVGIAEAATFPLMWALLAAFYAPGEIAHSYAALLACMSVAQIAGGPLAAALLAVDGLGGLAGWRWLFLVEAAPTVVRVVVFGGKGWAFRRGDGAPPPPQTRETYQKNPLALSLFTAPRRLGGPPAALPLRRALLISRRAGLAGGPPGGDRGRGGQSRRPGGRTGGDPSTPAPSLALRALGGPGRG